MSWLWALLSTDIGQALIVGLGALLGIGGWGLYKKRQGVSEEAQRAAQEDIENAEDIRRRVERDLADELRKHDGRGYRD
jgi:LPXTG-motif cell wall-anchored protein